MRESRRIAVGVVIIAAAIGAALPRGAHAQVASGPLTVHPKNPRYFADAQGHAVYLTGSHTWASLQDLWRTSYTAFDFNAYLDMMQGNGQNFIRLWHCEFPAARFGAGELIEYASPHPWLRTGPGTAGDGGLKFNLTQYDQAFFDRLRARCIAAGQRGMYVGIMLFEGYTFNNAAEGWFSHPFNVSNNINGVNGDSNGNGRGEETHALGIPAVTAVQDAYVRKVIDTVNDLDNIFYEVSNESPQGSVAWQNHVIALVKQYEPGLPKRHLVWMTTTLPNINSELWSSAADVISPGTLSNGGAYRDNPPANTGSKIIINDTDHLWGCGGSGAWVWKCFTRGLHPIYMEGYYDDGGSCSPDFDLRRQMGFTRQYALRMNLANAVPSGSLANTGWCLADAGDSYVVYAPNGGNVMLNLTAASGMLEVEWFNPGDGQTIVASPVSGGASRTFSPPFPGQAVLFVQRDPPGISNGDLNTDGQININDLLLVINSWGACAGCLGDANGDGAVNVNDLLLVINAWGAAVG